MQYKNVIISTIALLVLQLFLASCSGQIKPSSQLIVTQTAVRVPATQTPTITPSVVPTNTPVVLPVNRFQPLPSLSPITIENASSVTRIGSFENTSIKKVFLNDSHEKIFFQTFAGTQFINTADFTVGSFAHFPVAIFPSIYRTVSSNGKYVALGKSGSGSQFWNVEIDVFDIESNIKLCSFFPGSVIWGGYQLFLNFHENGGYCHSQAHCWMNHQLIVMPSTV
jgi:hypothetical protein